MSYSHYCGLCWDGPPGIAQNIIDRPDATRHFTKQHCINPERLGDSTSCHCGAVYPTITDLFAHSSNCKHKDLQLAALPGTVGVAHAELTIEGTNPVARREVVVELKPDGLEALLNCLEKSHFNIPDTVTEALKIYDQILKGNDVKHDGDTWTVG